MPASFGGDLVKDEDVRAFEQGDAATEHGNGG
jgi:hypothetical protein